MMDGSTRNRIRTVATVLFFSSAALLAPGSIRAQELIGRVVDARSNAAVSAATIRLLAGDSVIALTEASDSGTFSIHADSAGTYGLRVERIGYATARLGPVHLEVGARTDVLLRIAVDAVPLDALTVVSESVMPWLSRVGFYDRRRLGAGRFIERADIVKRDPRRTSDLLRSMPGLKLTATHDGGVDVMMRAAGTTSITNRNCRPQIYLDGIVVAHAHMQGFPEHRIDLDAILPGDLEAIEVYSGIGQIPAQYGGAHAGCGVMLIWTRK